MLSISSIHFIFSLSQFSLSNYERNNSNIPSLDFMQQLEVHLEISVFFQLAIIKMHFQIWHKFCIELID